MPTYHLIHAMLTHRGRVRQGNEDTCAAAPEIGAYVVCDGMGGAAAGEVASSLAADTFLSYLLLRGESAAKRRGAEEKMTAAIHAANQAVYQQSRRSSKLSGMGTTLVGLLYAPLDGEGKNGRRPAEHLNSRAGDPPTLWLGHVGDSRCYRRRRGRLEQLTHDHSLVEEQVRAGHITAEQALYSPMRNLITRAIGSQSTVEAEVQAHRPQPKDVYLLASDGLTHEVDDDEISGVLAAMPLTKDGLMAACEDLIAAANRNGGNDNITVMLVAVVADK